MDVTINISNWTFCCHLKHRENGLKKLKTCWQFSKMIVWYLLLPNEEKNLQTRFAFLKAITLNQGCKTKNLLINLG